MAVFTRFGRDVDEATARLLRRGECLTELLKQGKGEPLDVFDETAILLAFNLDAFYDVPKNEIRKAAKELVAFLREHNSAVVKSVIKSGDLTDSAQKELEESIKDFKEKYEQHK